MSNTLTSSNITTKKIYQIGIYVLANNDFCHKTFSSGFIELGIIKTAKSQGISSLKLVGRR